ncbi:MAG: hypothetical protein ACRDNW_14460, partial [Trebonia sp.]
MRAVCTRPACALAEDAPTEETAVEGVGGIDIPALARVPVDAPAVDAWAAAPWCPVTDSVI